MRGSFSFIHGVLATDSYICFCFSPSSAGDRASGGSVASHRKSKKLVHLLKGRCFVLSFVEEPKRMLPPPIDFIGKPARETPVSFYATGNNDPYFIQIFGLGMR